MEKVNNMQEQISNISIEMGNSKNQNEMLEIKKYCNRNEEFL
jgi:ribosomal protein L33